MTKAEYMYKLVDECMTICCQNNILVENFELSDEVDFYEEMEMQFTSCLKFYSEMKTLVDRNEISEAVMEKELNMMLALLKQSALAKLYNDLQIFLDRVDIPEKREQSIILKDELQNKNVDANYLINKLTNLRKMEQRNVMEAYK